MEDGMYLVDKKHGKKVVHASEKNDRKKRRGIFYVIQKNNRLQRTEATTSSVNWSELPPKLLEVILKKLPTIVDRIRFGIVCLSWQRVYRNSRSSRLPRQLPMLIFQDHENHALSFFNPFVGMRGEKLYDLGIHIPHTSHYIGSSEGWMVIEEGAELTNSVRLLNPFMSVNNEICLPLLAPTPLNPWPSKIRKVVLSANPASNSDYVAVAIYISFSYLAFCRSGDEPWTRIPCPTTNFFNDVIYYSHKFYAVQENDDLMVCDLSNPHPVLRHVSKTPPSGPHTEKYLVESSGDLLCIYREICSYTVSTTGFRSFKMDPNKLVWNEVKSLCGQILFLGGISSMVVASSHFPDCRESNCIYFGYDSYAQFVWHLSLDTTVFNLEDRSFEQLLPPKRRSAIWIEPKLQGC